MQSESKAEQIIKSGLSSTKFIVPVTEIVGNLVDKSFESERMKNLDEISTPKMFTELSVEWYSSDRPKWS